jgi:hypothetical protein
MQMIGYEASLRDSLIAGLVLGAATGFYTHSLGNWLFIVVLITIGPLATTELGTDGWMPELLKLSGPDFPNFATWIFVYVSVIMTVLRFYAGPIMHKVSPIALLVIGATVYALGKTFLWSTTLGLTAEQFPKGGALTLNGVSAVGVLFLGVLGSPYIGHKQDLDMAERLTATEHSALYAQIKGEPKAGIFGNAPTLNQEKIKTLPAPQHQELETVQAASKRSVFTTIAILPSFMLACYLGMFFWFRSRGGYQPVVISEGDARQAH